MEPGDVARLAHHENDLRRSAGNEPLTAINGGLGAYVPLDGVQPENARVPEPGMTFLDATAIGSVLVIRFRWAGDDLDRDLLLPIDFSRAGSNLDGASTWLLEYLRQRVDHDRSWFPRDVIPISDGVAVVRPVRHPG